MSKITLKEFWESEKKLAIHCDMEEKANKLLIEFDKMGKKWRNGDSYLKNNEWECYEKGIYYTNTRTCYHLNYYERKNIEIYEFEDVIFESESDKILELLLEIQKNISGEIRPLRTKNDMGNMEVIFSSKIPFFKESITIENVIMPTLYVNFDKKVVVLKTCKNETIKIQCHKDDKFDWKIGFALCLSKLKKDNFKYKQHREYFRKKGVLDIKKYTNWVLTEYFNNDLISMEQELKVMEKKLLEKGKYIL